MRLKVDWPGLMLRVAVKLLSVWSSFHERAGVESSKAETPATEDSSVSTATFQLLSWLNVSFWTNCKWTKGNVLVLLNWIFFEWWIVELNQSSIKCSKHCCYNESFWVMLSVIIGQQAKALWSLLWFPFDTNRHQRDSDTLLSRNNGFSEQRNSGQWDADSSLLTSSSKLCLHWITNEFPKRSLFGGKQQKALITSRT